MKGGTADEWGKGGLLKVVMEQLGICGENCQWTPNSRHM